MRSALPKAGGLSQWACSAAFRMRIRGMGGIPFGAWGIPLPGSSKKTFVDSARSVQRTSLIKPPKEMSLMSKNGAFFEFCPMETERQPRTTGCLRVSGHRQRTRPRSQERQVRVRNGRGPSLRDRTHFEGNPDFVTQAEIDAYQSDVAQGARCLHCENSGPKEIELRVACAVIASQGAGTAARVQTSPRGGAASPEGAALLPVGAINPGPRPHAQETDAQAQAKSGTAIAAREGFLAVTSHCLATVGLDIDERVRALAGSFGTGWNARQRHRCVSGSKPN